METAQCAIALGSNQGNSQAILAAALDTLNQTAKMAVLAQSSWYQTAPIGPPQPDYINACAILAVKLSPQSVLETLLAVEQRFGRVRRERWGPRTLDLDLLLYNDLVVNSPSLKIPHPRMRERAFVLVPLAEIAPQWVDPITGQAIEQLARAVDTAGVAKLGVN